MKNARISSLLLALLLACHWSLGQGSPFQLSLEPVQIADMPGLQSFAVGTHAGEWLLVGGRVDGLHRRQPFASFDSAGHHYAVVVVSPQAGRVWSAPLTSLEPAIAAQFSATNHQYHQHGQRLYLTGGYGLDPATGNHVTHDRLSVIDIAGMVQAVKAGTSLAPHVRSLRDPKFRVTGGQLGMIDGQFYLVGGHDFQGSYNPMGPDHGPGFVQRYVNALRAFEVVDDGQRLSVNWTREEVDSVLWRRRDYNMVAQRSAAGEELIVFSGVFQTRADIPYLDCKRITAQSAQPIANFQQHYSQYHGAHMALYAAATGTQHTVFFGGIGEYYDSLGIHTLDAGVPFVRTVSRVSCAGAACAEYRLPVEMPAYLGAGAAFIPLPDAPQYPEEVLDLDQLPAGKTLVGYVVGGIESRDDNVFWVNEGEHSKASAAVFKVYVTRDASAPADHQNVQSSSSLQLEVLPDPYKQLLKLDFYQANAGAIQVTLQDHRGKTVFKFNEKPGTTGQKHLELPCKPLKKGGRFVMRLKIGEEALTLGLVVEP